MNEMGFALKAATRAESRAASAFWETTSLHSGLRCTWQNGAPAPLRRTTRYTVELVLKRVVDVLGALAGLIALGPFLLVVSFCIAASSRGPVLFRQTRVGRNGTTFGIFKFRTMYVESADATGLRQTIHGDERVTRIGRFLRAKSIDELPQLINVLLGEMSLVGPRPHVPGMLAAGRPYEELVPYYDQRHVLRPGITGWAQANGFRGPTDDPGLARARVDHDLAYVQNFSLWLDMRALLRTIQELAGGTGV